jgi:glycosyltransferase involved in cell wall biosynthesis
VTTKLRILHCMRAPVGGLFRHVLDLAGEQARLGHDVGIVADSTASDRLTTLRFDAIKPHLSLGLTLLAIDRKPGIGDLTTASRIGRHARDLKIDILHGHGAKGGAYARLAGRVLRDKKMPVKNFYTPHGGSLNIDPTGLQGRMTLGAERVMRSFTSGFIFESAYALRIFEERIGSNGTPVKVIPNGLGPQDFAPHVANADAADVLYIGELRDVKGIDVLLNALHEIRKSRPVSAVIVGAGPSEAELKAQAEALGLTEAVRFAGAMPAAQAFPLGRCMVVPSRKESFPYVVLEAGATGIPLISTNVGGISEIVSGTDTDLIPADDCDALVKALLQTLADPTAARAKAERLREHVGNRFTVANMTNDVLNFYRSA